MRRDSYSGYLIDIDHVSSMNFDNTVANHDADVKNVKM